MSGQTSIDEFQVHPVSVELTESAFDLLQVVGEWIKSKERRQRIGHTGFQTYLKWQSDGANYVVLDGGQVAGVFSLPYETFEDWPTFSDRGSKIWLRALATHPSFRGRGVGEFAVNAASKMIGAGNELYLDCVSEFLPQYYAKLGFEWIAEQTCNYPNAETYDITLMCRKYR